MVILTEYTLATELRRWFYKSIIIDDIEFESHHTLLASSLNLFLTDYNRYFPGETEIQLDKVLGRTELQGILLYRLARNYFVSNNINAADKCSLLGRFLSGFEIYYSAEIGKALKINHGLGMVIGARTKIGDDALLHQGVTFGDKNGGRPVVGNNVTVYAGAKILGNVSIGNNVIIAANCVCFINVPENKTAVGIPARIINK
ncbi:MAG: serine O-acetyltransferase [Bacteroidota bacterium]